MSKYRSSSAYNQLLTAHTMSKKIMNYLPPFRPKLAEKRSEFIEIWHT